MNKIFFISSFLGGLIIEGEDWNKQLVGSDKEEHGCIGSAGYTWCEVKNKCLRTWEEECIEEEENNKKMTDEEIIYFFRCQQLVKKSGFLFVATKGLLTFAFFFGIGVLDVVPG